MTTSAQENLVRLVLCLQAGRPVPRDVLQWLCEAVTVYLEGGERLDAALGLRQAGRRTPATQAKLQYRNYWLRQAAEQLPEASPCAQAERLAALIAYFETRVPPHRQRPEALTSPLKEIALAAAEGLQLPRSPKRLKTILQK
jgi:hypothetical protein